MRLHASVTRDRALTASAFAPGGTVVRRSQTQPTNRLPIVSFMRQSDTTWSTRGLVRTWTVAHMDWCARRSRGGLQSSRCPAAPRPHVAFPDTADAGCIHGVGPFPQEPSGPGTLRCIPSEASVQDAADRQELPLHESRESEFSRVPTDSIREDLQLPQFGN